MARYGSIHLLSPICIVLLAARNASHAFVFQFLSISGRPKTTMVQSASNDVSKTSEDSQELIDLLLLGDNSRNDDWKARISTLVEKLTAMNVEVDPRDCLDGPLFVSHVVSGPTPLWEKLGLKLARNNIQGQQYVYNLEEKSVINYAEVWGKSIHVRAYGTYVKDETDSLQSETDETSKNGLFSFLSTPAKRSFLRCPSDFVVTVNRACLSVFGNEFSIPIAGTGYLRVLYADRNVRIFISPKSTTDDRWEKAGLVVAQVRVELSDPDFQALT